MKKTIFVCAACISIVMVQAQDSRSSVAPPSPPPPVMEMIAPPPPPPPPVPPAPTSEKIHSYTVIINENGTEIWVKKVNSVEMVFVKKEGKTQKIKLSTWNANRKYYEKKYGKLPPPPPPVPAIEEEVNFTAPVINKDN